MTSLAIAQTDVEVVGVQEFLGKEIPVIEGGFGEGETVVLTKTIAEIHEVELRDLNKLINNNIDEFEEGIDILDLKSNEDFAVVAKNSGLYSQNALNASLNIYLLSEQGYHALVSLMRTEKSKEIRKQLRREYFAMRKKIKEEPKCVEDLIIMQAQRLKDMREQINQANNNALRANKIAEEAKEEAKTIKEVVSLDTTGWRKETQNLINKIAIKQGGFDHINLLKTKSYELLNKRFGVSLETRLKNKKSRMALEGVSKTKIKNLNNLDVIAEDKKLIEGYVIIVKDMAIKYGI